MAPCAERDLRGQVRRRAEAVDGQSSARWKRGALQRSVSDDARAQQRCRVLVVERLGQLVGERLVHERVLGEPPVGVPAREARREAEVLLASATPPAHAARPSEPRDADPLAECEPPRRRTARLDSPDDLVARHGPRSAWRQVAFREVQIRPAHPACGDPHQDLSGGRVRDRPFHAHQRLGTNRPRSVDDPCSHLGSVPRRSAAAQATTRP